MSTAEIGVFGGSGFYSFVEAREEIVVETPYGAPSDSIVLGEVAGRQVAFLPRHGRGHTIPPHKINYRANIWAMKELGVKQIIAPCACGSLRKEIGRGDFVVPDQFVDRTRGRADTFYDGPKVVHIAGAEPFCPRLRSALVSACKSTGSAVHESGVIVAVQGPRFSTKAESRWFSANGWDIVNMTVYPEVVLARELEICYASIAVVTDYDVGLTDDPSIPPVSVEEVLAAFTDALSRLRTVLFEALSQLTAERNCLCATALKGAVINE